MLSRRGEMAGTAVAAGDGRGGRRRIDAKADAKPDMKTDVKSRVKADAKLDAKSEGKAPLAAGEKTTKGSDLSTSEGTVSKRDKPIKSKILAKNKVVPSATKIKKKKKKKKDVISDLASTVSAAAAAAGTEGGAAYSKEVRSAVLEKEAKELNKGKLEEMKANEAQEGEEKEEEKQEKEEETASWSWMMGYTNKCVSLRELFMASDLYSSNSEEDGSTSSEIRAEDVAEEDTTEADGKALIVEFPEENARDELPAGKHSASAPLLKVEDAERSNYESMCPSLAFGTSEAGNDPVFSISKNPFQQQNDEERTKEQQECSKYEYTQEHSSPITLEKEAKEATSEEKGFHMGSSKTGFEAKSVEPECISQAPSRNEDICEKSTPNDSANIIYITTSGEESLELYTPRVKDTDDTDENATLLSSGMILSNQSASGLKSEELQIVPSQEVISPSNCANNLENVSIPMRNIPDDTSISCLLSTPSKNNNNTKFNWSDAEKKVGWSYLSDCKSVCDAEYSEDTVFSSFSLQDLSCYVSSKIQSHMNEGFTEEVYAFSIGDSYFDFDSHRQHPIPIHRLTMDILKRIETNVNEPMKKEIRFDSDVRESEGKSNLFLGRKKPFSSSSDGEVSSASSYPCKDSFLLICPSSTDQDAPTSAANTSMENSESSPSVSTSCAVPRSLQTTTCSFSFPEDPHSPILSSRVSVAGSSELSFVSLSAAVSAAVSASASASADAAARVGAWGFDGSAWGGVAEASATMASAVSSPMSSYVSNKRCTLGCSGDSECKRCCGSDNCSDSHYFYAVSADPSRRPSWEKEMLCSESRSSVCVFVMPSGSKSSSLGASLDTVDEVSSNEFFTDSFDCAVPALAQDPSDVHGYSQVNHLLEVPPGQKVQQTQEIQKDALSLLFDGRDHCLAASLIDETAAAFRMDRLSPTSASSSPAPAPSSSQESVAVSVSNDGVTEASDVAARKKGSSSESLVTAESCCSDSLQSDRDSVMVVMCCSDSSGADSDVADLTPSLPRISRVCMRCTGKAPLPATPGAEAARRFAPDLVSDLPEGCSAGTTTLTAAGRREARHRCDCDRDRKPKVMERRPESAQPSLQPPPAEGSEHIVVAPLKDRIQNYKSAVAAPSRPGSASRIHLGTSSTRVKERILAFNAGLRDAAPRDNAARVGSREVMTKCPPSASSSPPPPPPDCDRVRESAKGQSLHQNAAAGLLSPEVEAEQPLKPSPVEGVELGPEKVGSAPGVTLESSELIPRRPSPADFSTKDRSVLELYNAVSTNSPSTWAASETEGKMAIQAMVAPGDALRGRHAVSMVLAAVAAAYLWYVYVN